MATVTHAPRHVRTVAEPWGARVRSRTRISVRGSRIRHGRAHGISRRAIARAMTLLLLVAAVVFVALAVGPRTGRYQTLTMLTGSMSPAIDAGDVVVVVPVRPADVRVGDVITFEAPVADRHVVTHRVVGLDTSGSRPRLQTKGDANAVRDPWDAEITDDVAWRVRYVVPGAGSLLQRLREPGVQLLLRWAVPAILLAWSLLAIWRPRRDDA